MEQAEGEEAARDDEEPAQAGAVEDLEAEEEMVGDSEDEEDAGQKGDEVDPDEEEVPVRLEDLGEARSLNTAEFMDEIKRVLDEEVDSQVQEARSLNRELAACPPGRADCLPYERYGFDLMSSSSIHPLPDLPFFKKSSTVPSSWRKSTEFMEEINRTFRWSHMFKLQRFSLTRRPNHRFKLQQFKLVRRHEGRDSSCGGSNRRGGTEGRGSSSDGSYV